MSRPARVLSALVAAYQQSIGLMLSPRCRFEPSCSAYAREALAVHGALRGLVLITWRLLRCQPFGTPGYDPVPEPRAHHAGVGRGAHSC